MQTIQTLYKEARDLDSFGFSFVGDLPNGDNIATSTWSSDAGITLASPSFSAAGQTTAIKISGGVPKGQYLVRNDVASVAGLQRQRAFLLVVTDDAA